MTDQTTWHVRTDSIAGCAYLNLYWPSEPDGDVVTEPIADGVNLDRNGVGAPIGVEVVSLDAEFPRDALIAAGVPADALDFFRYMLAEEFGPEESAQQTPVVIPETVTVQATVTTTYTIRRVDVENAYGIDPRYPDWAEQAVASDQEQAADGRVSAIDVITWGDTEPTITLAIKETRP